MRLEFGPKEWRYGFTAGSRISSWHFCSSRLPSVIPSCSSLNSLKEKLNQHTQTEGQLAGFSMVLTPLSYQSKVIQGKIVIFYKRTDLLKLLHTWIWGVHVVFSGGLLLIFLLQRTLKFRWGTSNGKCCVARTSCEAFKMASCPPGPLVYGMIKDDECFLVKGLEFSNSEAGRG